MALDRLRLIRVNTKMVTPESSRAGIRNHAGISHAVTSPTGRNGLGQAAINTSKYEDGNELELEITPEVSLSML